MLWEREESSIQTDRAALSLSGTILSQAELSWAVLGPHDTRGDQRGEDIQYGCIKFLEKGSSINQDIQRGLVFLPDKYPGGLLKTPTPGIMNAGQMDSSY